jgi:hypothetical protein
VRDGERRESRESKESRESRESCPSAQLTKRHATNTYGGVDVYTRGIFTSTLVRGERSASSPGCLIPRFPLERALEPRRPNSRPRERQRNAEWGGREDGAWRRTFGSSSQKVAIAWRGSSRFGRFG